MGTGMDVNVCNLQADVWIVWTYIKITKG